MLKLLLRMTFFEVLCFHVLDGKFFQEKVQSIMYLRNSSSGGRSIDSPALTITSPTGFSSVHQEGESSTSVLNNNLAGFVID